MKQINMVKLKIYKYIIWQKYREKEAFISHFYLWGILSLKIGSFKFCKSEPFPCCDKEQTIF